MVYARVRDPEARVRLRALLDDLPGVRANASIFEVDTLGWEEGWWDAEVEKMRDLIDPDTDTLIYWQVIGGKLVRTCIAGRFS